jgi:hypothetical protein
LSTTCTTPPSNEAGAGDLLRREVDHQLLAGQRRQRALVEHVRGGLATVDDVLQQDRAQRRLALGAEQLRDGPLRQRIERGVGRGEDRHRARGQFETGGLDAGEQLREARPTSDGHQVRAGAVRGGRAAVAGATFTAEGRDRAHVQRERPGLLVGDRDADRLDLRGVQGRRVLHRAAEAVEAEAIERQTHLRPLAVPGLELLLERARHHAHVADAHVEGVLAPVAPDLEHEALGAGTDAFANGGSHLREAAVVLERQLAGEAKDARGRLTDLAGRQAAHDAVEHGAPRADAVLEVEAQGLRDGRSGEGRAGDGERGEREVAIHASPGDRAGSGPVGLRLRRAAGCVRGERAPAARQTAARARPRLGRTAGRRPARGKVLGGFARAAGNPVQKRTPPPTMKPCTARSALKV